MKAVRATVVAVLLVADAASAHHSYAMFEVNKTVSLTGTVSKWEWTNPHTWLVVVAPASDGKNVEWQIEGSSPAVWRRYGRNREIVKTGDRVTVMIHPLRSGANGGQLQSITTADGKTIDLSANPQP